MQLQCGFWTSLFVLGGEGLRTLFLCRCDFWLLGVPVPCEMQAARSQETELLSFAQPRGPAWAVCLALAGPLPSTSAQKIQQLGLGTH